MIWILCQFCVRAQTTGFHFISLVSLVSMGNDTTHYVFCLRRENLSASLCTCLINVYWLKNQIESLQIYQHTNCLFFFWRAGKEAFTVNWQQKFHCIISIQTELYHIEYYPNPVEWHWIELFHCQNWTGLEKEEKKVAWSLACIYCMCDDVTVNALCW